MPAPEHKQVGLVTGLNGGSAVDAAGNLYLGDNFGNREVELVALQAA
jgi:hypothetical protein